MRNKKIISILDAFVIIISISMNISIIPYFIFSNFENPIFVHLSITILTIFLFFIRFNTKINIIKYYKYPPLIIFFTLLLIQIFAGFVKSELRFILAPLLFLLNTIFFSAYIFKLFETNYKDEKVFTNRYFYLNRYYILFAILNVLLVDLSGFLQLIGSITPFSNSINHLFYALLKSNIEDGNTFYFMPSWISIQTFDARLGLSTGTLSGLTHEPHVFGYLVFPTLFLLISNYYEKYKIKLLIILIFLIAFILSFSVTSFLVLLICFFIMFLFDKIKSKLITVTFFAIIVTLLSFETEIIEIIAEYSNVKLFENTSSLDYTSSRIESIIFPNNDFFGDGVLLLSDSNQKNAGIFSSVFYVIFYISIMLIILKNLFINDYRVRLIAISFLYFFLHGIKLSSSVFAMPYSVYFLSLMSIFNYYFNNSKFNESTKNN